MIAARGTDVGGEVVGHVTNGLARVEDGNIAMHVDDWGRVVGDNWRNEASQGVRNLRHASGAVRDREVVFSQT